jgi:trk system potassium uptake protein TrkA
VQEIYVKVISNDHDRVLQKLGVTETIFPERESGQRLATRIESRSILNYVRLGPDFSIQEMAVPESWIGRSLRELALPRRYRVSVVAVHDVLQDRIIPVPDPDSPLKESDTLLLSGDDEDLARVAKVK